MLTLNDFQLWELTDINPGFRSESKKIRIILEHQDDPFDLASLAVTTAKARGFDGKDMQFQVVGRDSSGIQVIVFDLFFGTFISGKSK